MAVRDFSGSMEGKWIRPDAEGDGREEANRGGLGMRDVIKLLLAVALVGAFSAAVGSVGTACTRAELYRNICGADVTWRGVYGRHEVPKECTE